MRNETHAIRAEVLCREVKRLKKLEKKNVQSAGKSDGLAIT